MSEYSDYINGEIIGNPDLMIEGLCGIDNGKSNHISYIHADIYWDGTLPYQQLQLLYSYCAYLQQVL